VEKHGGRFPNDFDDVLALPGIGRYTAGAICSIAFDQPAPILDGNVMRVLARLFGIRGNVREKKTNARLWNLAEQLIAEAAKLRSSDELKDGRPAQRLSTAPPLTPTLPMNLPLAVMVGRRCPHRAVVLCSPPSQRSSPSPGALRTTSPYRQVHGRTNAVADLRDAIVDSSRWYH
jgi:hypothetical protein